LIKAVIATARDIATAVDSASLLPQAEEALAQGMSRSLLKM